MYVGFTPTRARGMWLWQRLELRCGMPHHDLAPLQPGLVIDGTYELQTRVGSGGAAEVWLALAPSAVPVAVKFLRSAHDPRLDRLLAREIGHTARLSHPHIVDILAQGVVGEHRYAVLEWMEGGSLSEQLHALTLPDVTQVLRAILGALAHAHGRSLRHLDVKPENIMCATVRPDWRLLDFGIARHLHGGGGLKVAGVRRGAGIPSCPMPTSSAPGSSSSWPSTRLEGPARPRPPFESSRPASACRSRLLRPPPATC